MALEAAPMAHRDFRLADSHSRQGVVTTAAATISALTSNSGTCIGLSGIVCSVLMWPAILGVSSAPRCHPR
jgi:hypothetical protein